MNFFGQVSFIYLSPISKKMNLLRENSKIKIKNLLITDPIDLKTNFVRLYLLSRNYKMIFIIELKESIPRKLSKRYNV